MGKNAFRILNKAIVMFYHMQRPVILPLSNQKLYQMSHLRALSIFRVSLEILLSSDRKHINQVFPDRKLSTMRLHIDFHNSYLNKFTLHV